MPNDVLYILNDVRLSRPLLLMSVVPFFHHVIETKHKNVFFPRISPQNAGAKNTGQEGAFTNLLLLRRQIFFRRALSFSLPPSLSSAGTSGAP